MRKNQGKRVNKRKTKDSMFRPSVLLIGAITLIMTITMGVQTLEMQAKIRDYDMVIEELETRKGQEELRTVDIEEFEKYTGTDQYIEEVAREKLGMVYPDEYILTAAE